MKIRRYEYEIPKLYEKLEYLEVKSIGYNSPSFEARISSNGSSAYLGIDFWLEKIDDCEREIKYKEIEVKKYLNFSNQLEELERYIFIDYFYNFFSPREIITKHEIKRSSFYNCVNKIIKSFYLI